MSTLGYYWVQLRRLCENVERVTNVPIHSKWLRWLRQLRNFYNRTERCHSTSLDYPQLPIGMISVPRTSRRRQY